MMRVKFYKPHYGPQFYVDAAVPSLHDKRTNFIAIETRTCLKSTPNWKREGHVCLVFERHTSSHCLSGALSYG